MNQAYQFKRLVEKDFPHHTIPDLVDLYQFSPEKYPFLLQSSVNDVPLTTKQQSRYDILFIQPEYWLKMDKHFQLSTSENLSISLNQTFLQAFDELWYQQQRSAKSNNALERITSTETEIDKDDDKPQLPFTGGWFVFFAYELAQQVEPGLKLPEHQGELPVAYAARVSRAIIHDHHSKQYFLLSENRFDLDVSYRELVEDIRQSQKVRAKPGHKQFSLSALQEDKDDQFITAAAKVRHYIREGDVFQVNLSRTWKTQLSQVFKHGFHCYSAALLYRSLRNTNPAPFSGLVSFIDEHSKSSIISSSPERLLTVRNNIIQSRPIAGTRPRSTSVVEDKLLLEELHDHPKEQAEHVMLIDLIRNDLGRVCEPGTVRVDEFMINESYAHVHHIVSNVIGRKQKNKTPGQVIKAIFPGGTITGCPKVRCMEIIAELEKTSRSAYTGSMGYINIDGSMDLNILIRTMQLEQIPVKKNLPENLPATFDCLSSETGQLLSFRAGAGLVTDSIAENELHETRAKAKGLLRALEPFMQAKHGS